jgi:hypothetical protein
MFRNIACIDQLDNYEVLFIPSLQVIDLEFVDALDNIVQGGKKPSNGSF